MYSIYKIASPIIITLKSGFRNLDSEIWHKPRKGILPVEPLFLELFLDISTSRALILELFLDISTSRAPFLGTILGYFY